MSKEGHKASVAPGSPVFGSENLDSNPCPVIYTELWRGKDDI